jgi:hypothetical protein
MRMSPLTRTTTSSWTSWCRAKASPIGHPEAVPLAACDGATESVALDQPMDIGSYTKDPDLYSVTISIR